MQQHIIGKKYYFIIAFSEEGFPKYLKFQNVLIVNEIGERKKKGIDALKLIIQKLLVSSKTTHQYVLFEVKIIQRIFTFHYIPKSYCGRALSPDFTMHGTIVSISSDTSIGLISFYVHYAVHFYCVNESQTQCSDILNGMPPVERHYRPIACTCSS